MRSKQLNIIVQGIMVVCFTTTAIAGTLTGTTSMDFLSLTHSVKSESLGNAVTAISDSRAMSINPSSIAKTGGIEVQTHYLSYVESVHFANVAAVIPLKRTILGCNIGWIDFGSQTRTTLTDRSGDSGEIFSSKGYVAELSLARTFNKLDVGAGIKRVVQTLDNSETHAIGIDAGISYKLNPALNLGASITNITLEKNSDGNLQTEFRIGAGYTSQNEKWPIIGTLDFIKRQEGVNAATGIQYDVTPVFSLRAGYNTTADTSKFSAGIGLNLQQVHVDFSYRPSSEFGPSYRVGIGVRL